MAVLRQRHRPPRHRGDVAQRHQRAGVEPAQQLGDAAAVRERHHRQAAAHRLHHHAGQRVLARGKHEAVGGAEVVDHVGHVARQVEAARGRGGVEFGLEIGVQGGVDRA